MRPMVFREEPITPLPEAARVSELVETLRLAHGLDVSNFSEDFLARSFERRRQVLADMSAPAYMRLLEQEKPEADVFMRSLEIHHSEFFRDPLVFALLEQRLLPELARTKATSDYPELRVWSAGCAAGQEAYSIAILLRELSETAGIPVRFRLFATDNSEEQLQCAVAGVYPSNAMGNVALRHLERWFSRHEDAYVVAPELRELVDFSIHGLLDEYSGSPSASIFAEFDLVFCCNLLFYYRPDCQRRMLDRLRRCLAPQGCLVTGEAEREIVQSAGFQPLALPSAIFRAVR